MEKVEEGLPGTCDGTGTLLLYFDRENLLSMIVEKQIGKKMTLAGTIHTN